MVRTDKVRSIILIVILAVTVLYALYDMQQSGILLKTREPEGEARSREGILRYKKVLEADPNDYKALWYLSSCHSELGVLLEERERESKGHILKAIEYARRAIAVKEDGFEGHLYLAEALGISLKNEGPNERVKFVREVKKEAERAVELNPDHYRGHLMLGIWHRKVYDASWVEKKLANIFLGGLPEASLVKAEEFLKRSAELKPNFPKTHYELGLVYRDTGKRELALREFEKVVTCPITNIKEEEVLDESIRQIRRLKKKVKR